jgi:hypothetical protein
MSIIPTNLLRIDQKMFGMNISLWGEYKGVRRRASATKEVRETVRALALCHRHVWTLSAIKKLHNPYKYIPKKQQTLTLNG